MASKNSNDLRLKSHYKMYCNILSNVIKEDKWNNYKNQILKSNNAIKAISEIVKLESGRKNINEEVKVLNIDGISTNNP